MSSTRPGERNRLNDELAKIDERHAKVKDYITHIQRNIASGTPVSIAQVQQMRTKAAKLSERQKTVRQKLAALSRGGVWPFQSPTAKPSPTKDIIDAAVNQQIQQATEKENRLTNQIQDLETKLKAGNLPHEKSVQLRQQLADIYSQRRVNNYNHRSLRLAYGKGHGRTKRRKRTRRATRK